MNYKSFLLLKLKRLKTKNGYQKFQLYHGEQSLNDVIPTLIKISFVHGQKIDAPKPLKKRINKYRKLSKSLSKKTRGSYRYKKARVRVAKFS